MLDIRVLRVRSQREYNLGIEGLMLQRQANENLIACLHIIPLEEKIEILPVPWGGRQYEVVTSPLDPICGTYNAQQLNGLNLKVSGPRLDWVVFSCSQHDQAAPVHPDWIRSVRDQCRGIVPFNFTGWGRWVPSYEIGDMMDPQQAHNTGSMTFLISSRAEGDIQMLQVDPGDGGCLLDGREWAQLPYALKEVF